MARPLTPISKDRINEYRIKIENAIKENDKQTLKETKRLFIVYIKKRGKKITDFKRYAIYKYFKDREKQTKIEVFEDIIKRYEKKTNKKINENNFAELDIDGKYQYLKRERLKGKKYKQREYRKRLFITKRLQEKYGKKYNWKKIVLNYFLYGSLWYNFDEDETELNEIDKLRKIIENLKENGNKVKLYIIKKTNEEAGFDCAEYINDYFDNKIDDYEKDFIEIIKSCINEYARKYLYEEIEKLINRYAKEYDKKVEKENRIKLYIIEKTRDEQGNEWAEIMKNYFDNKIGDDKKEIIKQYVEEYTQSYKNIILDNHLIRFSSLRR